MKYDVVIIGGGLAGLTSAIALSKEGKKVAVLEKHYMPGGYATNFKRKDALENTYVFDVALHGIGGLREENPLNIILKEKLGVLKNIELLEKKEAATILNLKGEENDIPSSFNEYKGYLSSKYKNNESDINKLFEFLMKLKEDMVEVTRQGNKVPKYNDYLQSITIYDFLREYTDNEQLINEFSFLWLYYGLPPKSLNAFYYLLPWISYHIGGTFYIKGGAGNLSNILANEIEKLGSKVYLSSEVKEVITVENKVVAVKTRKGDEFKGDNFIIACDPNNIFNLITNDNNDVINYKEKLKFLDVGISLSQLYIGLDCKSTEIGITKGDYFIEEVSHEECYESILNGDYKKMNFGITSYDVLDESLNGNRQGVIVAVIGDVIDNWPEYKSQEYKDKKKELEKILLEKVEKVFPKIKRHITILELGTPHTMKQYTNNSRGAVYGWEQSVGQGAIERLGFKTPFSNVLLAGAWTNPGGGFEGAITSGYLCAERLLKDSNKANNSISNNEELMDINIFMEGMAANVNPKKAKGLDFIIEFNFYNRDRYYIQVKSGKGKVVKKSNLKSDITINTAYETWYDIAFNGKSGDNAYFDGELKLNGDMELFEKIPEIFDTNNLEVKEQSESKLKLNSIAWVNLALIPWIVYWILGAYINDQLMTIITVVYITLFVLILKPKGKRELSILEGGTLILFVTDSYVCSILPSLNGIYLDAGLILIFIFSIIINRPIIGAYSKFEYSGAVVKTRLFNKINKTLTAVWTIVFTMVFIVKLILIGPIENIAYIFIIVGIMTSYLYPKRKLGI